MAQRVSLQPNLAAQYEISSLPDAVQDWVRYWYDVVTPDNVRICDGSKQEAENLQNLMLASGQLQKVADPRYENCWYCCTDPADVARVESKTVISTRRQSETIPYASEGVQGRLGRWMNPAQLEEQLESRTPNCMVGRTMYRVEFLKLCFISVQFRFFPGNFREISFKTTLCTSSPFQWELLAGICQKLVFKSRIRRTSCSLNTSWPESVQKFLTLSKKMEAENTWNVSIRSGVR